MLFFWFERSLSGKIYVAGQVLFILPGLFLSFGVLFVSPRQRYERKKDPENEKEMDVQKHNGNVKAINLYPLMQLISFG